MARPSKYGDEFKKDAVRLVRESHRTCADVARELGMNRETLRVWVREAERAESDTGAGLARSEREELARLRKRVAELEIEKEILRKAAAYFEGDGSLIGRLQFISAHRLVYGVKRLCRVLNVARSAFYAWLGREPARAARAVEDKRIVEKIRRFHGVSGGTNGSPRITADLRDDGERVNEKRVARLMRVHGIVGLHLRKGRRTTIPDELAPSAPDLLKRDFTVGEVNRRWCGDITYLPVGDSWLYLATVIDIGSRRLVGWSIADHLRTELISDALTAAVGARGGQVDGVIFHGDRGCQYTSAEFAALCDGYRVRRSAGRTGTCLDNALAEAFNATLKRELLHGRGKRRWSSEVEARTEIFRWIAWYNHRRRHSATGNLPPAVYEDQLGMVTELAA
ncbi:IS3 family transposase [Microtetraspora malaysiensis]|uniref:IS3 family transposase n=1 Tax=Microtetraspora malaysiensis TaxID=161358 RepID=UPI003D8C8FF5